MSQLTKQAPSLAAMHGALGRIAAVGAGMAPGGLDAAARGGSERSACDGSEAGAHDPRA